MFRNQFLAGLTSALAVSSSALAAPVCTTGELFAGAPDFEEPMKRARNGQGLLDVPPLGFRVLVFAGDRLVTAVGPEIWYSDLSADTPTLTRLAGRVGSARDSIPGACKSARFVNISGLALMPDGSLAGADQASNNLFQITDPFGPDCNVAFIAGAVQPQVPLANGVPTNAGDADGAGTSGAVLLRGPDWVAATDDGTIYFIDSGNTKLKKIAPDAVRTVETVTKLPEGTYYALIAEGGKLYAIANNDISEGFLIEVDPVTAEVNDIARGRSDFWLSNGSINVSGLASDGEGFFTSQSGQLIYVTPDGEVESIAGNGAYFEYTGDYDPSQPHPADELQLRSARRTMTAGANVFLAQRDGHVYFSAAGDTAYVLRIACK